MRSASAAEHVAAHPVIEDRRQAAAEQQGAEVVEFGEREAVGRVELFGERRQLPWPR